MKMAKLTFLMSLCLVLLYSSLKSAESKKGHVYIHNMSLHRAEIMVHCWSKDDDLGFHVLGYDSSTPYEFSFGINYFSYTEFECDVLFGKGNYKRVTVFNWNKDCPKDQCHWKLDEVKPCLNAVKGVLCYNYY